MKLTKMMYNSHKKLIKSGGIPNFDYHGFYGLKTPFSHHEIDKNTILRYNLAHMFINNCLWVSKESSLCAECKSVKKILIGTC